jgi:hypothetical protein
MGVSAAHPGEQVRSPTYGRMASRPDFAERDRSRLRALQCRPRVSCSQLAWNDKALLAGNHA